MYLRQFAVVLVSFLVSKSNILDRCSGFREQTVKQKHPELIHYSLMSEAKLTFTVIHLLTGFLSSAEAKGFFTACYFSLIFPTS